jgi:uncharacterized protein YgiB involved in biofilm formation
MHYKNIKLSKISALLFMGISVALLTACQEDETEVNNFSSVQECFASGAMNENDCQKSFDEATLAHESIAPRYESLKDCEAQYGEGKCGTAPNGTTQESGSWFMPFMAGYMVSNLLSGNNRSYQAAPAYVTSSGKTITADGQEVRKDGNGKTKIASSVFNRKTTSAPKMHAVKPVVSKPRTSFNKNPGFQPIRRSTSFGRPSFRPSFGRR